jgi:opacity protein-like surface antigen
MKTLILAASLTLLAVPAFAADATAPQQTAMSTDAQQKHSYTAQSDEGRMSNIEIRNTRMRRVEMERSNNAKASWAGSAHYY